MNSFLLVLLSARALTKENEQVGEEGGEGRGV